MLGCVVREDFGFDARSSGGVVVVLGRDKALWMPGERIGAPVAGVGVQSGERTVNCCLGRNCILSAVDDERLRSISGCFDELG